MGQCFRCPLSCNMTNKKVQRIAKPWLRRVFLVETVCEVKFVCASQNECTLANPYTQQWIIFLILIMSKCQSLLKLKHE